MAIVQTNPHQTALAALQQELQQRLQQQQWIGKRISDLKTAIEHLTPLAQESFNAGEEMSLPQLCLRVLSFTPAVGVSVPKIRDGLALMGVEISANNPLAVLHTTMGRLVQRGYVIPMNGGFQITRGGKNYLQAL